MQHSSLEITTPLAHPLPPGGSLCGFLGSFDPPHLGHEWIIGQLLARFDAVALLVPHYHFEKTIEPDVNATLAQRQAMLRLIRRQAPQRIAVGVAHEVLYVRLARALRQTFSTDQVFFGMGDDTYLKVLRSRDYFARRGLPWGPAEQAELAALGERVVVFARTRSLRGSVAVAPSIKDLSSTKFRQSRGPEAVSARVRQFITENELYPLP